MRKPVVGETVVALKTVGSLKARSKHVVSDVVYPHDDEGNRLNHEDAQADGGWWIKSPTLGDEWHAISLFRFKDNS